MLLFFAERNDYIKQCIFVGYSFAALLFLICITIAFNRQKAKCLFFAFVVAFIIVVLVKMHCE